MSTAEVIPFVPPVTRQVRPMRQELWDLVDIEAKRPLTPAEQEAMDGIFAEMAEQDARLHRTSTNFHE